MDVLEAIRTRRSIRVFDNRAVPEEAIEQVLAAAMMAPSARNARPWQFVVIDDASLLGQIPQSCPNASMVSAAPLAILVCGDLDREISKGYWPVDCSAAVENMLLTAHAIGLGAVWCGVYPRETRMQGLGRLLRLPERVIAHSLVVVGYPDEQPSQPDRFDAGRIHRNGWT